MPALNEEGNLASAVATVRAAFENRVAEYEVIVFDDGSADGTGALADRLTRDDPRLTVVHHPRPMGIGRCYWEGVGRARFEYVLMVPGDNEVPQPALDRLVDHAGVADVVAPYFVNPWVRPPSRRLLSRLFTRLMNRLFGLNLRYYNGPCLIRTELVRSLPTAHDGFAYMAAILTRLAAAAHRIVEVGIPLGMRRAGGSKAVSVKNAVDVCRTMLSVYLEVRALRRRHGASLAPEPVQSAQEKKP
jgi:glycosyltransferase involved in cell wall biosynthesis